MDDTAIITSSVRVQQRRPPPGGNPRKRLNWAYAALSLLIGVMLWFGVDLKRMKETVIDAEVRYEMQLPADWKFVVPPLHSVRILLRGTNPEITNLSKREIHVEPEYPKTAFQGDAYEGGVTLLPANVKQLPSGVEVISITPQIIPVHLVKLITRYLPVEAGEIVGTPMEGYTFGRVHQIDPSAMPISASREFLSKITSTDVIRTKPFTVDDGKDLVGANIGLEPLVKDGEVVEVPGIVYMTVELDEVPEERRFEQPFEVRALVDSPFDRYGRLNLAPPSVMVTAAGPKSVIDKLAAGEIVVYADMRDRIPAAAGEFNIKLKAITPARVRVSRIEPDTVKWITGPAEKTEPETAATAPATGQ